MHSLTTRSAMKDFSGSLLLAHPSLKDKNFHHSVIGIAKYKHTVGALGVVLNKPLRLTLGDFDEEKWQGIEDTPVFEGGPMEKKRIILTALEWDKDSRLFKWHLGLNREVAQSLIRENPSVALRAFVGYAGWENGQLENEVRSNAWVLAPMAPDYLLAAGHGQLWMDLLIHFHPVLALWDALPKDPTLN